MLRRVVINHAGGLERALRCVGSPGLERMCGHKCDSKEYAPSVFLVSSDAPVVQWCDRNGVVYVATRCEYGDKKENDVFLNGESLDAIVQQLVDVCKPLKEFLGKTVILAPQPPLYVNLDPEQTWRNDFYQEEGRYIVLKTSNHRKLLQDVHRSAVSTHLKPSPTVVYGVADVLSNIGSGDTITPIEHLVPDSILEKLHHGSEIGDDIAQPLSRGPLKDYGYDSEYNSQRLPDSLSCRPLRISQRPNTLLRHRY